MTRFGANLAMLVLVLAPLGCDKQEATPAADPEVPPAAPSTPAVADKDPFAEIPTEADYEEQADLAIDSINYVDRLDELEKEIEGADPG